MFLRIYADPCYEVCGFYDQAFCISKEIISFDFDVCTDPSKGFNCLPECVSTRHQTDGFQNGIYRPTPITSGTNDIHMSTMVLYMTEVEEVMFEETPEYTLENYLGLRGSIKIYFQITLLLGKIPTPKSDVGGAAGLILGMSAATIVGFIEYLMLNLVCHVHFFANKITYKLLIQKTTLFAKGK